MLSLKHIWFFAIALGLTLVLSGVYFHSEASALISCGNTIILYSTLTYFFYCFVQSKEYKRSLIRKFLNKDAKIHMIFWDTNLQKKKCILPVKIIECFYTDEKNIFFKSEYASGKYICFAGSIFSKRVYLVDRFGRKYDTREHQFPHNMTDFQHLFEEIEDFKRSVFDGNNCGLDLDNIIVKVEK